MKKLKKLINLMVILLFGVSTLMVTSCGWNASEDDIKMLEETKSAALSAETTLADKKSENQKLQSDAKSKEAEFKKIQADKAKVQKKVEETKAGEE